MLMAEAAITPLRAMIDPTDKSMPPLMMTKATKPVRKGRRCFMKQ